MSELFIDPSESMGTASKRSVRFNTTMYGDFIAVDAESVSLETLKSMLQSARLVVICAISSRTSPRDDVAMTIAYENDNGCMCVWDPESHGELNVVAMNDQSFVLDSFGSSREVMLVRNNSSEGGK